MGRAFMDGGWGMIPTSLFGLLLLAAAIRYAMSPEARYVPLQLSLGIMTLAAGGLGFTTGLIKSVSVLGKVEPDQRWIWLLGMGESLNNIALALALVTLSAIAASVGAYRLSRALPTHRAAA